LLKRVVALKIVGRVRRDGGDLAMLLRFRREVEAAGRLRHPGIAAAYDAGESDGRLYLAMEYVEGIDLERFVQESGVLPVDLAGEVMRQTAEALGHAHEAGLIHRDIKPSNLMLASPGVNVKLLDLGLARFTDNMMSADEGEPCEAELCGTPNFMAPEWGRDPQTIDARSDLYSLGCTFYYLLTGQVPYPGGSWTEKLLRHSFESPPHLRELRPDVPPEVAAVVERLMAHEPEERYGSAADVVAALRDPPPALAPSERESETAPRAQRGPKARRFSCGALTAIMLGVAAAGGARWIVTPPSAPPTSSPPGEPRSARPFTIEGRAGGFASLEKAVGAAHDGDIITVHGTGPFVSQPMNWQAKTLTVRSDGTSRPRLEMKPNDDPWQALFRTDRTLTLEGLELAIASGSPEAPLIYGEQASLNLTDCRVTGSADGVAIIARNPPEVVLHGCRIEAGSVGLSVEVGARESCRMRLENNRLTARGEFGAALSLWAPEVRGATAVRLELEGNTIGAGRMTALRALPSGPTIAARGNRFTYRSALFSYSGYAYGTAWRGTVVEGDGNSYEGPAAWLWVEGRPATTPAIERPR
jgi:hypothetical protein